jgi:hypothetical protein
LTDDQLKEAIEHYIDRHGTQAVLDRVAEVCRAKAEHLVSAWQDSKSAKAWNGQANSIEYAGTMAKRRGL